MIGIGFAVLMKSLRPGIVISAAAFQGGAGGGM